eukprot:TRINITY_DN6150_c0_g1_i2.p1 TRINITY_DN6150_c0_g1~~TRINITY_DN6150_c0_g1_i2.p1  ORF type:complete len:473 (+),score=188.79 TRINITY_DN6150_c0_g1_i2:46-1464(+)
MSMFPDCPHHDLKVTLLFSEFDVRKTQAIDIEGLIVVFKRLNIPFSTATVNDLFEKGDANGDGVINVPEFKRFAELYPTLIDCLYYRAKDYWTNEAQKEGIEEMKRVLDELRESESCIERDLAHQKMAVADAERRLQAQLQALADSQRKETEAKSNIDNAHDATERCRAELRDRVAELNRTKDIERQKQLELSERQRTLEHAIRRLQQQEGEVTKAQERLRDIERMLAEQQREVDRQINGAERCRAEAEAEEQREAEAHAVAAEALRMVHSAADDVSHTEERLAQIAETERQAALALREAAEETSRQLNRREQEQRAVLSAQQLEAAKVTELAAAQEALAEHQRLLHQQIQENEDFVDKRRQVDSEESPLVEQEVRLREQRENLERKESRLRSDFSHFAGRTTHQRGESPRGLSPVPSAALASPQKQLDPLMPVISSPRSIPVYGVETRSGSYNYYSEVRKSTSIPRSQRHA